MASKKSPPTPLLYADTEHSADMLYFGGVAVPDPFVALAIQGRKVAVVSRLEFARVVKESDFDLVLPLEEILRTAGAGLKDRKPDARDVVLHLARQHRLKRFLVPREFPVWLGFALRDAGLEIEVAPGLIFPEREFKGDAEAAAIREGNAASAAGFAEVERMLKASTIARGRILFEGHVLTSERLREAIEIACLRRGALAMNTIVAGGDQACDPHCRGSGPLKPNELIIVDIFPRVAATGYHGDMTRTYLKGQASEAQRKLVATVYRAQQEALPKFRAGADGRAIYEGVCRTFAAAGYETKTAGGLSVGFFHGLGHGLGLEVHEPPRVSAVDATLRVGQVITVEPGLYYPGLGGCRIEDVVRVTAGAPELLSKHGYRWELA